MGSALTLLGPHKLDAVAQNRIAVDGGAHLQTADACRAIVATQKTVHPSEQAALDVLDKPLPVLA